MGMSLGEMARDGEQRRKVMQVRGTLADVFTEALQLALGKDSDSSDHDAISVRVAMETSAQETQFLQDVAEQYGNGDYKHTNDPIEVTPENKVVVDVIDGDSPDEVQLLEATRTIDVFDKLEGDNKRTMHAEPSEYVMVIARRQFGDDYSDNEDVQRRRSLLDTVANKARGNGHRVETVTLERRNA